MSEPEIVGSYGRGVRQSAAQVFIDQPGEAERPDLCPTGAIHGIVKERPGPTQSGRSFCATGRALLPFATNL
jgi:hypothetical protein